MLFRSSEPSPERLRAGLVPSEPSPERLRAGLVPSEPSPERLRAGLVPSEPKKFYNVILFLGNQKKYLFGNKITPMNMNSGSTIKDIYVSVWRKEEYEKVLIHELCHYISIDFDIFLNDKINKDINNIFNLEGINHVSESYNETVACIINMLYKSVKLNIDRKSTRLNSSHTDISRMPSSA